MLTHVYKPQSYRKLIKVYMRCLYIKQSQLCNDLFSWNELWEMFKNKMNKDAETALIFKLSNISVM